MSLPLPVPSPDAPMTLRTRLFGEITVAADRVLAFSHGLPGFPEAIHWARLDGPVPTLGWLQSADEPGLCFLIARTEVVEPAAERDYPGTWAIVTLPKGEEPATANLRAPVTIDRRARTGKQVIPQESRFSTTHPFDLGALLGGGADAR